MRSRHVLVNPLRAYKLNLNLVMELPAIKPLIEEPNSLKFNVYGHLSNIFLNEAHTYAYYDDEAIGVFNNDLLLTHVLRNVLFNTGMLLEFSYKSNLLMKLTLGLDELTLYLVET